MGTRGLQLQVRRRFLRGDRIRAAKEFRAAVQGGEKVSLEDLSLFICRRGGPGRRLGLAIPGRVGGAVARNRMKRRLREYVRLHQEQMAEGLDLVVVVRRDLSRMDPKTFQAIVGDLFGRGGLFRNLPPQYAKESVHTDS